MKLLTQIWLAPCPWPAKCAFYLRMAREACASGDLALALEAMRYVSTMVDARQQKLHRDYQLGIDTVEAVW